MSAPLECACVDGPFKGTTIKMQPVRWIDFPLDKMVRRIGPDGEPYLGYARARYRREGSRLIFEGEE